MGNAYSLDAYPPGSFDNALHTYFFGKVCDHPKYDRESIFKYNAELRCNKECPFCQSQIRIEYKTICAGHGEYYNNLYIRCSCGLSFLFVTRNPLTYGTMVRGRRCGLLNMTLTDEEIVKALECCNEEGDCALCPYERARFPDELECTEELHADAFVLINRRKAEIEALTINMNAYGLTVKRLAEERRSLEIEFEGKKGGA